MIWLFLACSSDPADLAADTADECDAEAQLDAAREATARFADVEVARAEGYVATSPCDADIDGAAMGIHYVRISESLDQQVDLLEPDILLYLPDDDGLRLVGIEYVVPALLDGEPWSEHDPPTEGTWADPPELFCRPFDGPMAGHNPLQPWHYDLHVWVHSEDNPDGVFAQYHPALSCD